VTGGSGTAIGQFVGPLLHDHFQHLHENGLARRIGALELEPPLEFPLHLFCCRSRRVSKKTKQTNKQKNQKQKT
jgi:hypothetical protein